MKKKKLVQKGLTFCIKPTLILLNFRYLILHIFIEFVNTKSWSLKKVISKDPLLIIIFNTLLLNNAPWYSEPLFLNLFNWYQRLSLGRVTFLDRSTTAFIARWADASSYLVLKIVHALLDPALAIFTTCRLFEHCLKLLDLLLTSSGAQEESVVICWVGFRITGRAGKRGRPEPLHFLSESVTMLLKSQLWIVEVLFGYQVICGLHIRHTK